MSPSEQPLSEAPRQHTEAIVARERWRRMHVIDTPELERLVRTNFPAKERFSAESDLGLHGAHLPAIAFVHGGPDPYLDRSLDAWLTDGSAFASLYPLLNRLCRVGGARSG